MDLLTITDNLSQMSKQLTIIQDYITLKFGVDFQEFYISRSVEEQELEETSEHQDNQLVVVAISSLHSNSSEDTGSNVAHTQSQSQEVSLNPEIVNVHVKTEDEFFSEMDVFSDGPDQDRRMETFVDGPEETIEQAFIDDVDLKEEDYGTGDYAVVSLPKTRKTKPRRSKTKAAKRNSGRILSTSTIKKTSTANASGAGNHNDSQQTQQRRSIKYEKSNCYENLSIAKNSIKAQNQFSYQGGKRFTRDGRKEYYYCKVSRFCPARMYLLIDEHKPEVTCYRTFADHDHAKERNNGMPLRSKLKIDQLMDSGIKKPKGILRHLQSLPNFPIPSHRQIIDYTNHRRKSLQRRGTRLTMDAI